MSRTVANLQADNTYPDMLVPLMPGADVVQVAVSTETSKIIRVAAGQYALQTATASVAYTILGGVTGLVYRTGVQDDYQEAFGSSRAGGALGLPIGWPQTLSTGSTVAGQNVSIPVNSSVNFSVGQKITVDVGGPQEFTFITSIPDATHIVAASLANSHTTPFPITGNLFTTPGSRTGRPPFTGLSQLTPQTAAPPKGINLKQLTIIYSVTGAAITVPTVGMFATQFSNVVAPVTTTLITQATNGLQTATNAQPYVVPVPVPLANQGFIVTPNTLVGVEFDFTNGTTATAVNVFGFVLTGQYNYD
jgi:hypothetical protein